MAYLRSFEDEPISLEGAVNRVLDDVFLHFRPVWACVHVRAGREHGVVIEIVAEHGVNE
jgi:NADPH-dependent 7-cyano-7-deazaguanine reductase QueF